MASTYSGGMRRKLDLAMTLVTRPQIIFLDEPTTGLDPRSRRMMWDIVRELVTDGVMLHDAARLLNGSAVDDTALTLRVPTDGGVKSVRALLDRLDEHSIDVEEFSVHIPDLDDVFLALTGHASMEEIAQ